MIGASEEARDLQERARRRDNPLASSDLEHVESGAQRLSPSRMVRQRARAFEPARRSALWDAARCCMMVRSGAHALVEVPKPPPSPPPPCPPPPSPSPSPSEEDRHHHNNAASSVILDLLAEVSGVTTHA